MGLIQIQSTPQLRRNQRNRIAHAAESPPKPCFVKRIRYALSTGSIPREIWYCSNFWIQSVVFLCESTQGGNTNQIEWDSLSAPFASPEAKAPGPEPCPNAFFRAWKMHSAMSLLENSEMSLFCSIEKESLKLLGLSINSIKPLESTFDCALTL